MWWEEQTGNARKCERTAWSTSNTVWNIKYSKKYKNINGIGPSWFEIKRFTIKPFSFHMCHALDTSENVLKLKLTQIVSPTIPYQQKENYKIQCFLQFSIHLSTFCTNYILCISLNNCNSHCQALHKIYNYSDI